MKKKLMFGGKESRKEEMAEAKALKSGKISPKQYVKGEMSEGRGKGAAMKAAAIKSGKLSPAKYASKEATGMKCGGKVKRYAEGGVISDDNYEYRDSYDAPAEQQYTDTDPIAAAKARIAEMDAEYASRRKTVEPTKKAAPRKAPPSKPAASKESPSKALPGRAVTGKTETKGSAMRPGAYMGAQKSYSGEKKMATGGKVPAPKPDEKKPSNYQEVMDAKMRAKEEKAPTTKTQMGKVFKSGGTVRGTGCAKRGTSFKGVK